MKTITLTMIVLFGWAASPLRASTTIDTNNAYAYGANIGWINAFADGTRNPERLVFLAFQPVYRENQAFVVSGSGQIALGELL